MLTSTVITSFLASLVYAQNNQSNASLVRLPSELLYLLPQPFDSDISYSWLNSTSTGNSTINELLAQANKARFVSYSDEFSAIIGPNPSWYTIDSPQDEPNAAFEGGAWLPETDEVWFSYSGFVYPEHHPITSFSLRNRTSKQIHTNPPIRYPYGMYYWPYNKKLYATEFSGFPTYPATVISISDPSNKNSVTPIFNSYQARNNYTGKDYIYATTFSIHTNIPSVPLQRFDTAVWRYSLSDHTLLPVIGPNEQRAPNGIRVSPDGKKLYVTNTPLIGQHIFEDQAKNTTKANSIYVYDLDEEGFPRNGRLFGLVRTGIANGIHIDDKGRVWTAENDGINVRNEEGFVLGSFGYGGWKDVDEPFIANFALAGDRLVIGASSFVLVYQLGEEVVGGVRRVVN